MVNFESIFPPKNRVFCLLTYFAQQRSLYDFGVFLCCTVAMAQFPIFSITPAEHLIGIMEKVKTCCYLLQFPSHVEVKNLKNKICKKKHVAVVVLTSYLSLYSDGQSVTIRALGGGHLLHVPVWLQHKFLGHGLVVGVPQPQPAIAAFSTSFH